MNFYYIATDTYQVIKESSVSNLHLITLGSIIISAFVTLYFFVEFSPKINLNIIPEWIDKKEGKLILKIEIENRSKVRVQIKNDSKNEKEGMIRLQILEYDKNETLNLSEWVPFTKNSLRFGEQPIEWKEPIKILETTKFIYPNEIVKVERFYTLPKNRIWHVGFQIQAHYNFFERIIIPKKPKSWTTTKVIYLEYN